ncbi:Ppx/GppA phosphatase family protein [Rhodohalobacter halophilus]|uniref:Ppx/GppA phosphatase family protein n=1 Tax=Rhodohalobacter halophilus TaxID=1812810 RepID=UPI00083FB1AA|nr:Ppx/GppA phosphatase family protein [Rhodohalobacter halophilus]
MINPSFPHRPIKRIAAIDLGTNSFHALIVDIYPDGGFYTVDKLKEMVLLAEKGLGDDLSDAAMERGISALKKIKVLADSYEAETILAYATSAIREAGNGGEFIQRAIDEVGVKINAIPGRIEAELIGLAVQHGIQMPEAPSMIMDIGGGSVEFIVADQEKFYHLSSKKIGVARMTAQFIDHDPIKPDEIEKLKNHFEKSLTDVAEAFALHRSKTLIGSSGTMENIAMMIAHRHNNTPNLTVNEMEFSAKQFFEFYDEVIGLNRKKRAQLKGLDEKRVDLLPAGLVLVHFILKKFGIKRVKISSQALREGIVLRYIKKELSEGVKVHLEENPRRRSVLELVHKCDWHEDHSQHVAKLALKIFDELRQDLELVDSDRELLEYAALMHDIGYHISHRKHHKHALYIINNADLMGFKEEEIDVMANVARYHRRSTPKNRHLHFKKLDKSVREKVKKLSGILRVADGLDRSHYQNVRDFEFERANGAIELKLITESDPNLEIWGAMRKKALFEEVTGRKLRITESG